ncbi:hypothetical protein FTX61_05175 [Nitriliruptoraceae bacterium ZYF776]|nr:hypothetical protein [Profundirhabdus halotolerans]
MTDRPSGSSPERATSSSPSARLPRRRLLVGAIAAIAAACGAGRDASDPPTAAPDREPPPDPPPPPEELPDPPEPPDEPDEPETGHPPAPDAVPDYVVSEQETHPNAKALGAAVAQALLTWEVGEDLPEVVARATNDRAVDDDVAVAEELWHPDSWSRGEVVYPQFGGLTQERCSIMAVVRQTVGRADGTELTHVRTLDVRLRLRDGAWSFEKLASGGGTPVERPDDLPAEADAVLDDERIVLPDTARWDIHAGITTAPLLAAMSRFADLSGGYEVNVLDTGHPRNVFGTDRRSDHTRGRAVDIHAIGGNLVIEDRAEGSGTDRAVEAMYADEARPILGSPWALDGFGGRSFTDPVHQDHVHLAVPRPADEGDVPDEELAP